ncbi:MAG TPA: hypothetical protein VF746_23880 [Longimicrobium sp.]
MIITLDPSEELERELVTEAARLRLSLAEYVLRVLSGNRIAVAGSNMPLTGPELVAFWMREGVVCSRTDSTESAEHVRALRERAERRS